MYEKLTYKDKEEIEEFAMQNLKLLDNFKG